MHTSTVRLLAACAQRPLSPSRPSRSETRGIVWREEIVDVAPVWSGHPVGFCLLTRGARQYVAFYDANRQMTVAQRTLDRAEWTMARLPEQVNWDSHNSDHGHRRRVHPPLREHALRAPGILQDPRAGRHHHL